MSPEISLQRRADIHRALQQILELSLLDDSLEEILERVLDVILHLEWLTLEKKGSVFLTQPKKRELYMVAHKNLSESLLQMCKTVPFGQCLCGRAALRQQMLFKHCIDEEHDYRPDGMQAHGHYNVPIIHQDESVGVINLYVAHGHIQQEDEIEFLQAAANAVAGIIRRKRVEQNLIELNNKLEHEVKIRTEEISSLARFPEENPFPVLRVSADNRLMYANQAAEEVVKGEQLCVGDVIPPQWVEFCAQARSKNKLIEFECIVGDAYYMLACSPTPREDGEVNIYGRDITMQRRVEQKVLHSDRLESLGVLAGGIAHDFNNLLTAILGNASLAQLRIEETSPARRYLDSIEKASQSAADLCRQMLAYAGKGQFIIKQIDLSALVGDMGKLVDVSLDKNVVLKYYLHEHLPLIEADTAQMQQIILNLITNASEAIDGKSGVIAISTGVMYADEEYLSGCIGDDNLEPGHYVYMEVSDTGCGMDSEVQKKIFDPFFTTKFTGRGLGMSAMRGIVQAHRGCLSIYSEKDKGTTIKVSFPVSHAVSGQLAQVKGIQESPWRKFGTILVIDDEEGVREIAVLMLESIGFRVLTACDGETGIALFKKHYKDISLVLLDMTMPQMNGDECFRELRRIQQDVRVLLSSGYGERDATERFNGKGLAGFIQKPYSAEALEEKLRETLATTLGSSE